MEELRKARENRESFVCNHCRPRRVGLPQVAKCNPSWGLDCWCSRPVLLPHNFGSDHKKTSEVVKRSEARQMIYIFDSYLTDLAALPVPVLVPLIFLAWCLHPFWTDSLTSPETSFRPIWLSGVWPALAIIPRSTLPSSSWKLPALSIEML